MNNLHSHNINTHGKSNSLALDKCSKADLDRHRGKITLNWHINKIVQTHGC